MHEVLLFSNKQKKGDDVMINAERTGAEAASLIANFSSAVSSGF